jgi:hypothetical protein
MTKKKLDLTDLVPRATPPNRSEPEPPSLDHQTYLPDSLKSHRQISPCLIAAAGAPSRRYRVTPPLLVRRPRRAPRDAPRRKTSGSIAVADAAGAATPMPAWRIFDVMLLLRAPSQAVDSHHDDPPPPAATPCLLASLTPTRERITDMTT